MKNVIETDLTGKVAVVTGASGTLCSIFAIALARAGVGKLILIDFDTVDIIQIVIAIPTEAVLIALHGEFKKVATACAGFQDCAHLAPIHAGQELACHIGRRRIELRFACWQIGGGREGVLSVLLRLCLALCFKIRIGRIKQCTLALNECIIIADFRPSLELAMAERPFIHIIRIDGIRLLPSVWADLPPHDLSDILAGETA